MAKTDALSIFQANGVDEEKLAESYTALVDQIQVTGLSNILKSGADQISGDPTSGSVEVRRLKTSTVKDYGTARAAGEGDKIKNNGVTVNLDTNKEIVEEVNKFDLKLFGLSGVIDRRRTNFALSVSRYLDTQFFAQAESAGIDTDVSAETTLVEKIEGLINALETTQNDNVDGVDRELMDLTVSTNVYGKLRNYIDTLPNPNEGGVDYKVFHDVRIHKNHRQTKDAIIQVRGSIAQPVAIIDFAFGDIPLSAEQALQLFFKKGTKAVMADLIRYADILDEVSV